MFKDMFKKKERLTKAEFSEAFSTGQRHQFSNLTVITKPLPTLKVAVVVGKKVAKSAVRRNILKRLIYASLREQLIAEGFKGVMIVLVKPPFATLPRKTAKVCMRNAIAEVLKKT
jgi:ribonuclease P protein component